MQRDLTIRCDLRSVKQNKFAFFPLAGNTRKLIAGMVVALLAVTIPKLVDGRGLPVQQGIRNFGQISEDLYRGAQPNEAGILNLKRLGIKTIVNLRMTDDAWQPEATLAQANGIIYTNVPFKGMGRPSEEQIAAALGIIKNSPGPVFVHCQYGCDRTGTIIACYRIQHDGWSSVEAMAEARHYGMSWFERGMRSYVLDFSKKAKLTLAKVATAD